MRALSRSACTLAGVTVLAAAVVGSALAAVYVRHESRGAFIELQRLLGERDRLQIEWGQLQIEQGALAQHGRVEALVREELDMRPPRPEEIRIIFGER